MRLPMASLHNSSSGFNVFQANILFAPGAAHISKISLIGWGIVNNVEAAKIEEKSRQL
ncbi:MULTISPECIES: hypothetical protein [unclassified Microcoleus]|uniref:hypothetical protein n=1 Tax=unclassified Microcoleus TaxID=2642155 RepID=UPI002FD5DB5F